MGCFWRTVPRQNWRQICFNFRLSLWNISCEVLWRGTSSTSQRVLQYRTRAIWTTPRLPYRRFPECFLKPTLKKCFWMHKHTLLIGLLPGTCSLRYRWYKNHSYMLTQAGILELSLQLQGRHVCSMRCCSRVQCGVFSSTLPFAMVEDTRSTLWKVENTCSTLLKGRAHVLYPSER